MLKHVPHGDHVKRPRRQCVSGQLVNLNVKVAGLTRLADCGRIDLKARHLPVALRLHEREKIAATIAGIQQSSTVRL
jgi:hypothetical protein